MALKQAAITLALAAAFGAVTEPPRGAGPNDTAAREAEPDPALAFSANTGEASRAQAMRNVPRISVDELKTLIDRKAVVVIDVRDPGQFREGRIPGSINIDYTEMPGRAKQFKGETRTIVAYCACVGDTTAARAALDLAAAGVPGAKALQGGWTEWVSRGEKIEK